MNPVESIMQAIVLGVTEGVTEFLPVSSSGHLLIVRKMLGLPLVGSLAFDAVLQLAAAVALVVYFWKDIAKLFTTLLIMLHIQKKDQFIDQKEKAFVWAIIAGTIPAVILGLLLEKYLDSTFRNVKLVALALVAGSLLMYSAQRFSEKYAKKFKGQFTRVSVFIGVAVGFFQSLALIPGVSRSGATIAGGLFSGLSREEAVRFSFLLSVPILLGSGLKELWSVRALLTAAAGAPLIAGSIASFVVALAAIYYMIRFLKTHNLTLFIWYRVLVALVVLWVL